MLFKFAESFKFSPKTNFTSLACFGFNQSTMFDASEADCEDWGAEDKMARLSKLYRASEAFSTSASKDALPAKLPEGNYAVCHEFKDKLTLVVKGSACVAYYEPKKMEVAVISDSSGVGEIVTIPFDPELRILLISAAVEEALPKAFVYGGFSTAFQSIEANGLRSLYSRAKTAGVEIETDFAAVYLSNYK